MNDNFFLVFNLADQTLTHGGTIITKYEHKTCSGERLVFELTPSGLTWQVPFFLLDNIFYFQIKEKIYFGRHLDQFRDIAEPDHDANALLKQHGFLPHARTQLKGVSIVCSYLKYAIGTAGITATPCFPQQGIDETYTVDDLMDVFRIAFRKQIEQVNRDTWLLPLSGGMDSRLLLSVALEHKDIDLQLYTVGTHRSGDVKVAQSISRSLGLAKKHQVLYLEDVTRRDLLQNYQSCDYLLPLDRILTKPLGNLFKPAAVLSGLYGDVIFADNVPDYTSYSNYYTNEGFVQYDSIDKQIVEAYEGLPALPKLQRMALRCQKLTRQSFPISPGFDFVTPFVDPQVVVVASNIRTSRIYQNLVARHMRSDLQKFIHQSTMSYFTHPNWLRVFERKFLKLLRHPARAPYYDTAYLKSIGVMPNEAPIPK
jgi:hypothetical protein